ncbi:MAG: hypothetical protein ABIG29_03110 [Candidatus Nealsonbacteria bacterium]
MNISIKARTELGNIFKIAVDPSGVVMRRTKGADGKPVKREVYRGDRLHFLDSRFVIRKGETIVGETFGKAVVTEITVS